MVKRQVEKLAAGEIEILLTTEGTYPVVRGGVSTWCDLLVRRVPGVRYTVLTVMANPYLPPRYELPSGVSRWIKVPLWGTEDPAEHLDLSTTELFERPERTTAAVVREKFLPVLSRVVDRFWSGPEEPLHGNSGLKGERMSNSEKTDLVSDLVELHRLFLEYDYHSLMKNLAVWQWYTSAAIERFAPRFNLRPTLHDLAQSMGWIYRFLIVLATPVPNADVIHSSAAALCALPGAVARFTRQVPFLLTEHGVYLREQYHSVGRSPLSPYLKRSLLGLTRAVSQVAYAAADVVAPVAAFNTRWERELGVPERKIRVAYNGVDPAVFQPRPRPAGMPATVVSVARIDPVKDLATLLQAAALVARKRPDVRFVVYGGVSAPAYYQQLLTLRDELGLAEQFTFAGHLDDVPAAYASGDVVALSSISEGFPYSVIEAMMCEKPVVATDVGGTREALGGTGLLVAPRSPDSMAAAILRLLEDPATARALAKDARERALALFTVQNFVRDYQNLYRKLAARETAGGRDRVRLTLIRTQALAAAGLHGKAAELASATLRETKEPPLRAVLLLELAKAQVRAGRVKAAGLTLVKVEALAALGDIAAA